MHNPKTNYQLALRLFKTQHILKTLDLFKGNQSKAARYLGISRGTLRTILHEHKTVVNGNIAENA